MKESDEFMIMKMFAVYTTFYDFGAHVYVQTECNQIYLI